MFSEAEWEIIRILGRRKMTIAQLTENFYFNGGKPNIVEPNNYIGAAVRRISKKCENNRLSWTIVGKRGAGGRTVWKAKR